MNGLTVLRTPAQHYSGRTLADVAAPPCWCPGSATTKSSVKAGKPHHGDLIRGGVEIFGSEARSRPGEAIPVRASGS
jgi:hypothetical protein